MARARRLARLKYRQEIFGEALDAWHAATEIREFCAALEQAATAAPGKQAASIGRWAAWGRAQADHIDPPPP